MADIHRNVLGNGDDLMLGTVIPTEHHPRPLYLIEPLSNMWTNFTSSVKPPLRRIHTNTHHPLSIHR